MLCLLIVGKHPTRQRDCCMAHSSIVQAEVRQGAEVGGRRIIKSEHVFTFQSIRGYHKKVFLRANKYFNQISLNLY